MYENYLAHHGILGMRWGVRRYQNKDGSLTSLGRKHAGIKSESPRHKPTNAKKLAKQRATNLEKARKARMEKKAYEESKRTALQKGTAAEVLKFKGDLTNKELQDAFTRINTEQSIAALAAKENKTVWDKIGSITDKVGKITNFTEKGISAWNVFAKIHNTFVDEEDRVPVIGGDNKPFDRDKKARDKEMVKYITKYGSFDQVAKYYDQMSIDQAKDAISRFVPQGTKDAKERKELISNLITEFGKNKQVFGKLDELSNAQIRSITERWEKERSEEEKKKKKNDDEDED